MKTPDLIIEFMSKNPSITLVEIAEQIGLTPRGIEKAVAKLKMEEKIEYIGPQKGGYWLIKS